MPKREFPDLEISSDRYDQLVDLLNAARVPNDINTALPLLQLAFCYFAYEGYTAKDLTNWMNGWFLIKEQILERQQSTEQATDKFINVMLETLMNETKES